jgi:polyphosphate kinase 2 (PPK2 family)
MAGIVTDEAELRLKETQHKLYSDKVPVLILIEGPGGYLMGRLVNRVMAMLEPRGVEYHHFKPDVEIYGGLMLRFMETAPAKGRICLYDRGWYSQIIELSKDQDRHIERAIELERYMADNGVIIVKLFLDMDPDRMGENKKSYPKQSNDNCGDLGDDAAKYSDYSPKKRSVASMIERTDTVYAPWDIVEVADYDDTVETMVMDILKRLEHRMQYPHVGRGSESMPVYCNPRKSADLTKSMDKDEYQERLDKLQVDLAAYQCKLAKSNKSLAIVFEGWDAAGKGGSIRRLTADLNPRGYKAVSVGVPSQEEYAHTYLWRFFGNIPRTGRITIFDRSWYGRMMVEPIEGFCTEEEYDRSSEEINLFEMAMTDNDVIVLKFWMEISKEEQLNRFNDRTEDPMKQWKITDDDWRNRSKWDVYEKYVDRMMELTNTPYAPWHVIESEDKRYGRIKTMETVVDVLKKELSH